MLFVLFICLVGYLLIFINRITYTSPFNVKNTLCLRGLLAIMIVVAYLSQYVDSQGLTLDASILSYVTLSIRNSAKYAVAIFFALSSYGLLASYKAKRDIYLDSFVSKRTKRLFIPLLPIVLLYQIYNICVGSFNIERIFCNLLKGGTFYLCPNTWFIILIFSFYLFFYLATRISKSLSYIFISTIVFSISFSLFAYCQDWGWHWITSNLGLVSGSLLAYQEKAISNYIIKNRFRLLILIMIAFIITGLLSIKYEILSFISCGIVPILVYLIVRNNKEMNSRIFTLLGHYSYEIYIVHGVLIVIFSQLEVPYLVVLFTIAALFPLCWTINRFYQMTA